MKRSALFWVFLAPVLMWLFLLISTGARKTQNKTTG